MDLKHTTKAELYEQLCEEQKKRKAAEAIMEKQAEHTKELERSYEQLEKDCLRKIDKKNDELAKATDELAELRMLAKAQNRQNAEAVQLANDMKAAAEEYHRALRWCIDHPWRNLWKCCLEWAGLSPRKDAPRWKEE